RGWQERAGEDRGGAPQPRTARRDDARDRRLGSVPYDQEPSRSWRYQGGDGHRQGRFRGQVRGDALRRGRLRGQAGRPQRAGGEGAPESRSGRAPIVKILARVQEPSLEEAVASAATEMSAELIMVRGADGASGEQQLLDGLRSHPGILIVEAGVGGSL